MPLSGRTQNDFLASLSIADFEELRPSLRVSELKYETVLVEAGSPVMRVYFPHSGIVSLVIRLKTGAMVEAAMVGRDGVFGAGCAVSGCASVCTAIVQIDGKASTIDAGVLRIAAAHSPTLLAALIQDDQRIHAQALQSAACNASHTVEARLARWLLRARDLSGDRLTFSQEFLAQMLGTHRNTVSLVAQSLQQGGLIRYVRGVIDIVDAAGLLSCACECYGAIKAITGGRRTDRRD